MDIKTEIITKVIKNANFWVKVLSGLIKRGNKRKHFMWT